MARGAGVSENAKERITWSIGVASLDLLCIPASLAKTLEGAGFGGCCARGLEPDGRLNDSDLEDVSREPV